MHADLFRIWHMSNYLLFKLSMSAWVHVRLRTYIFAMGCLEFLLASNDNRPTHLNAQIDLFSIMLGLKYRRGLLKSPNLKNRYFGVHLIDISYKRQCIFFRGVSLLAMMADQNDEMIKFYISSNAL